MSSSIRLPALPSFDGTNAGFIPFYSAICDLATIATTIRGLMLYVVLTPAEFALTPWAPGQGQPPMAEPVDPGLIPADPALFNVWKYRKDVYNCYCQEYSNFQAVLVAALNEDTRSLISVNAPIHHQTVPQLMDNLRAHFGTLSPKDLDKIKSTLFLPFDPSSTDINTFIRTHCQAHTVLANHGRIVAEADKITYLRQALNHCQLFEHCFTAYDVIHPTAATQTFTNFSAAARNYYHESTAVAARMSQVFPAYSMSNKASHQPSTLHKPRAASTSSPYPPGAGGNKAKPNLFCWTHGCGGHGSTDCKNPAPGHLRDASWDNPRNSPAYHKFLQQAFNRRGAPNNNKASNKFTANAAAVVSAPPFPPLDA
jgi:hypothetical protein